MRETIYATFVDAETATKVAGSLLDRGVKPEDLSILVKDQVMRTDERPMDANDVRTTAETGLSTTTPEDAASGAMKGAGIGLGVGVLAALAAVMVPGFGMVLGGGALATALGGVAGAGAAGAVAGAVTGYLKDQGIDDVSVERISKSLESGGALVSVSTPSGEVTTGDIEAVFQKYGGSPGFGMYSPTGTTTDLRMSSTGS